MKPCADLSVSRGRTTKGILQKLPRALRASLKPLLRRKFGIEIKGANVGKGTGVKSYFLWAPTQTIAEVRSRPSFFALVFVRALMFEASSCALLTRFFFVCRISSARCK